jgi:transposase
MAKKYTVCLDEAQRARLRRAVSMGKGPAREQAHARVLLKADEGLTDEEVSEAVEVSVRTVERVRRLFATAGVEAALKRRPQPPRPAKRKLDGEAEARLVMLACSKSPDGHDRWTLDLLADRMVKLNYVPAVSRDTVARALKKTRSSRG